MMDRSQSKFNPDSFKMPKISGEGNISITYLKEIYDDTINKQQEKQELEQCNVLIIGKSGVGKSTLTNAIFGKDKALTGVGEPVTKIIKKHEEDGYPIVIYDTPGLEISQTKTNELYKDVSQLIESQRKLETKDHIHVVWYCINHEGNRIESLEIEWLEKISLEGVPIILVITQTPKEQESSDFLIDLEGKFNTNQLPVKQIMPVMAKAKEFGSEFVLKTHGLEDLVEATAQMLPDVARAAFIREQIVSIDLKSEEAFRCVSQYAQAIAAISGVTDAISPVPLTSMVGMIPLLMKMFGEVSAIFETQLDVKLLGGILTAIFGQIGKLAATEILGNLFDFVPGFNVVDGLVSAGMAYGITLSLGAAYIETLKFFIKKSVNGEEITLSNLSDLILEKFKEYSSLNLMKRFDVSQVNFVKDYFLDLLKYGKLVKS